ncbi:MAG: hypothetical protein IKC34_01730 [Clostridia bacterium]|nr:hypothetical protein [Clostridia bacterium]
MAYAQGFDVKKKKRDMIKERIDTDPVALRGMRVSRAALLLLLLFRLVLLVFEIVYFSASELKIGVLSNLLLIPMLLILYMIYDGNKGLAGILMVSAVVRVIYLFSSVYPTLPDGVGADVYLGVYLFVMAFQFAAIILMTAYAPAVAYFDKMQAINMEVGTMLRTGGAQTSHTGQSRPSSKNHKKRKK